MRLLDRLVAGQFLKLFVLAVLATPPLFVLGEVTENLDRYYDMGLSGTEIARGYLFRLPEYLVWAFPISGLIAAIFTVHSMTTHREIVAAKAGGISFYRLVAPILVVGALLTAAALALTEVVPRSNRVAFRVLRNVEFRLDFRPEFVYQTDSGFLLASRRLTMYDSRMTGVQLLQRANGERPALYLNAAEAEWKESSGWTFMEGHLRLVHADGVDEAYGFQQLRLPALYEQPRDLLNEPPEHEEMTYAELERAARIIERSGGNANVLLVKKDQRIAIPAATLVIILFGVPLATSAKRGGTAYGIGAALGTTILYLLLFKVAGGFGSSGAISSQVAAWSPNVLFLLAGLALMAKVRT